MELEEKNYMLKATWMLLNRGAASLKHTLDVDIPKQLKQAYDTGGYWHDNPHWDYTLADQEKLNQRYYTIIGFLKDPTIIEDIAEDNPQGVSIGTEVKIQDTNLPDSETEAWRIVGTIDMTFNPQCQKGGYVSYKAPLVMPLIGKTVGEVVEINLPYGNKRQVIIQEVSTLPFIEAL